MWMDYRRLENRSLYDYLGNRESILVGRYGRDCSWLKGQLRFLGCCLALMAGVVMDPSLPAACKIATLRCSICIMIYEYNGSPDYWPIDRPTSH